MRHHARLHLGSDDGGLAICHARTLKRGHGLGRQLCAEAATLFEHLRQIILIAARKWIAQHSQRRHADERGAARAHLVGLGPLPDQHRLSYPH